MGVVEEGRAVQVQAHFVSAFDLWFPKQSDQRILWPSTVRLSEEYFQSLGKHAVPLDHRAVAALASSSMALDVYVWLAQRLHRVPAGRPQVITWAALYEQFGQGFARVRDFRRRFLHTLHQVQAAYPNARLSANRGGRQPRKQPAAGPTPLHRHAHRHARKAVAIRATVSWSRPCPPRKPQPPRKNLRKQARGPTARQALEFS